MLYIDACASWIRATQFMNMSILRRNYLSRNTTSLRNRTLRASCERCMQHKAIHSRIGSGTAWGADFADQGLDEQQTGGRPQTGSQSSRGRPVPPMVQHSFDLKEAQQSAEVLRMELAYRTRPGRRFPRSRAALRHPEMAAEAAKK